MKYPNKDYIEHLRRKYPPGTRLQLSCMEDEIGMGLTPPLSTLTAWLPCMAIWAKNSSGAFCRM